MKFIYVLTMLSLFGCGHIWVISQNQNGGVIGYSDFSSGTDAAPEVKKAIHCANWSPVADNARSAVVQENRLIVNQPQSQDTSVYDTNGNNLGSFRTISNNGEPTYSTVPMATVKYWREFTYRCN